METLLGLYPPLRREAWHRLKGWYWDVANRAPPPAQVNLKRITAERVDLYSYVPPLGDNISVAVEPFPVDYSVPMEDNIDWAVTQLHNHLFRWPSGMRAEHLKGWIAAARKKEKE